MIQTDIPCSRCSQPMIGIKHVKHYAIVCNNFGCPLHRQIQGNIEGDRARAAYKTFMPAPLNNTVSPPRGRIGKRGRKRTYARRGKRSG